MTGERSQQAPSRSLRIAVLGLSITSSWGNGHATNYRGLVRALVARGHEVAFLERDQPWYAANRDEPSPPWGRTELYGSVTDLIRRFDADIRHADAVIIGSYVPDGQEVAEFVLGTTSGVTFFYDIDTPVTINALEQGECSYLDGNLIPRFDCYLSFTGGPTLAELEDRFGARRAVAFYCMVDANAYRPLPVPTRWDLGYLGTYSPDRQETLDRLLVQAAVDRPDLRFVVAGPQYPAALSWPRNIERVEHVAPADHPTFYSAQRLTLNVTRADMIRRGWSPSVRLFEAAACAVPVVSDCWQGLDTVFRPETEIFVADRSSEVLEVLETLNEKRRASVGSAARARVTAEHTAEHRAITLESLVSELLVCGDSR